MFRKQPLFGLLTGTLMLLTGINQTASAQSVANHSSTSQPATAIEQQLLDKIATAQQTLDKVENTIINERKSLAKKLATVEQQVITLRNKTRVARRLADEQTLSLSKLEQRLSTWQQQQVFQKNLLHRFLQQHQTSSELLASAEITEQISQVITKSTQLSQQFSPSWQQSNIVMPNGEIDQHPLLTIGPVTWYWNDTSNQAGFSSLGAHDIWQHNGYVPNSGGLQDLQQSTVGNITFDPTLNRALARVQHQESMVDHVIKGGLWVIPILLFAVFALAIALAKVVQLWRLPPLIQLSPTMVKSLLSNNQQNDVLSAPIKGMQKTLLAIAATASSTAQRDDELFMQLHQDKHRLERRISAIAITAAVAPLLGLLGTVSGMIETFRMMTLFGSGDAEVVSGGISQALVTTELGLMVAIPALILNAILSRKAKAYYTDLENFAILLSKSNERLDQPYKISANAEASPQLIQEVVA